MKQNNTLLGLSAIIGIAGTISLIYAIFYSFESRDIGLSLWVLAVSVVFLFMANGVKNKHLVALTLLLLSLLYFASCKPKDANYINCNEIEIELLQLKRQQTEIENKIETLTFILEDCEM
jgi:hypothetical protein